MQNKRGGETSYSLILHVSRTLFLRSGTERNGCGVRFTQKILQIITKLTLYILQLFK